MVIPYFSAPMMHLTELQRLIDSVLPPRTAMAGDPIGVQVESRRGTAQNVLVCFEVTDAVIAEAVQHQCDCIITFHPLIYAPLRAISRADRVGRLVCSLLEHDIALVSVHTTFDAHPRGTNAILAERFGLRPLRPLDPLPEMPTHGMGMIAEAPEGMMMDDLLDVVGRVCGGSPRYCPAPSSAVRTVAMVAGSGATFLDAAISSGADVFVTADVKYHAYHAASGIIGLIDAGHFEMEQFVADGIIDVLRPAIADRSKLIASTALRNPVRYFTRKNEFSHS
ncbi:MAG: Nif3-like dinuclear metal center hexameric protein [Candidatus Kapabacteria bacterium]|nr:Nif3-like dinuclear metal center hexameric protein [Candidatus Kapabacteria bacterium]